MNSTNTITESKPYYVTFFCNPRNLHYLRERRKNNAENFAHGAEKAVKILDMLGRLKSVFPSGAGSKLAAVALPVMLLFSVASNKAGAEEIQVAANTPVMKEGVTKKKAAYQRPPIPRSKGNFVTSDLTKETRKGYLDMAPGAASNDRIAIVLRGENDDIEGAVMGSGELFAKRIHDVSLLVTKKDKESDPNSLILDIYADGRLQPEGLSIPIPFDLEGPALLRFQKQIIRAVYKEMYAAYKKDIEPYLMAEKPGPAITAQN